MNTRPLAAAARGASSDELARFSSDVAEDLLSLESRLASSEARLAQLGDRLTREGGSQAEIVQGLFHQFRVLAARSASRAEVVELAAAAGLDAPQDRATHYFNLIGDSVGHVLRFGLEKEHFIPREAIVHNDRGGLTLPITSRRSLLFGNDPENGRPVFADGVSASFSPIDEGAPVWTSQTDPIHALEDDERSPFLREVRLKAGSSRTSVLGEYTARIPPSLNGALELNLIELAPAPAHSCAVFDIRLYSPSGSLLQTINGPFYTPTTLPVRSAGLLGIGRISVRLAAVDSVARGGFKVFSYGLAKLGLYQASYAGSGRFEAYGESPNGLAISQYHELEYNASSGERDLVPSGRMRLKLQVPLQSIHNFPFGSREFDESWTTVYDSDSAIDNYKLTGRGANWFPESGVALSDPSPWFRVVGELRGTSGPRPLVSDIVVGYSQ